jgi:hypothetical protein
VTEKTTANVLALIDKGLTPRDALNQCGFGEVSAGTMAQLKARATRARNILLQGLYAAANDSKSSPSARAKAFDTWERLTREEETKDLNIVINIQGE